MSIVLAILGFALLDSLNPSVIAVTVYLVLHEPHYRRNVAVYLSAVFLTYFLVGIALLLMLDTAASSGALESRPAHIGQLVLAVVMFGGAVLAPSNPKQARDRLPRRLVPGALFALGVTVSLLEFVTALPYLAAIGIMVRAEFPLVAAVPSLVVYNLVMLLPPILLVVLYSAFGHRLEHRYQEFSDRVRSGSREAMLWVFGLVGFFLAADALSRLEVFGMVESWAR